MFLQWALNNCPCAFQRHRDTYRSKHWEVFWLRLHNSVVKIHSSDAKRYQVRVPSLAAYRSELFTVIALLISHCLWLGVSVREESKMATPYPSSNVLVRKSWWEKKSHDRLWILQLLLLSFNSCLDEKKHLIMNFQFLT